MCPFRVMQLFRRCLIRGGRTITSEVKTEPPIVDPFPVKRLQIPEPQLNWDYLCNSRNTAYLHSNVEKRKGRADIHNIVNLHQELQNCESGKERVTAFGKLLKEALKIPNDTHPELSEYGDEPKTIRTIGEAQKFSFKPLEFSQLADKLNVLHNKRLTPFCGNKSYYLMDELSQLEHALVRFSVDSLLKKGFQLISVPDILHHQIIESCGMDTQGPRNQIYRLDPEWHSDKAADGELCLSGTAEMALGGYFMNRILPKQKLPLKVVSVSRCYRAEIGVNAHEKGIYRVHFFTKVEMFGVSSKDESESLLNEFVSTQEELFSSLGLYLRTLDMPPCDLGAPAYRKYDVEAWLPGHNMFGELSSSSNCTDYQSRRLNIRYTAEKEPEFAHTVNGTACAIPRLLIALFETFQQENGCILIPKPLQPYLNGKTILDRKSVLKALNRQAALGELDTRAKQRIRMKQEKESNL